MALSITGVGLVSSLGHGAAGTCAGLRAGVAMPRELATERGAVTCLPAHEFAGGFRRTLADKFSAAGIRGFELSDPSTFTN